MEDNKTYIICSSHRDLYVGGIVHYDPATKSGRFKTVRHMAYWVCDVPGGLTSLCEHGPADGTRLGAPSRRSTLGDIVAVHECSSIAAKAFNDLEPSSD